MAEARPRILVTRKLPTAVEARLCSTYDVHLNSTDIPMSKAELSTAMTEFDALVSTVSDLLDAPVLRTGNRRVRIIANVGVGYSNIDIDTARRAALGLGMRVVFYNRSPITDLDFEATRLDSIDEVMASADVISVHVPGGGSTPLVTAGHIAKLKPTAFLINTARGDSIDQAALITALTNGRIAGAGLDVYAEEPDVPDALRTLENVTLLPHIGSATEEVRAAMGMVAADNLDALFSGSALPSRVV
jgi:lactate dehydrogenase-like 2-hydroxyacid dehydrogenase